MRGARLNESRHGSAKSNRPELAPAAGRETGTLPGLLTSHQGNRLRPLRDLSPHPLGGRGGVARPDPTPPGPPDS